MTDRRAEFVNRLEELMGLGRAVATKARVPSQDIEEVLNDALAKALDALADFRGEADLKSWFYSIVRNTSLTYLKTRSKRRHYGLSDPCDEANGYVIPEPGVEPDIETAFWSGDVHYELARLADEASDANWPSRKLPSRRPMRFLTCRHEHRAEAIPE